MSPLDHVHSRWRVLGRAAAVVFALLSVVLAIIGCVLIQFDDQYDASSVPERTLAGFFGGLLTAAISAPVTAVISLVLGGVTALFGRSGRHRPLDKESRGASGQRGHKGR